MLLNIIIFKYINNVLTVNSSQLITPNQTGERSSSSSSSDAVDCILSSWGQWSACSVNCKRTRHRKIVQRPRNGGKQCDKLVKTQRCKECVSANNNDSSLNNNRHNSKGSNGRHSTEFRSRGNSRSNNQSTTTTHSYSMDEEDDDSKFSRLRQSNSNPLLITQNLPFTEQINQSNHSIRSTPERQESGDGDGHLLGSTSFIIKARENKSKKQSY